MPLRWTADLALGVNELDQQHQGLFLMVSALDEAIGAGRLDRVADTVRFVDRYAAEHFATEERYMRLHGYPALPEHRAAHLAFKARFLRHRRWFASQGVRPLLVVDLASSLITWLNDHVRTMDGELGRYLASVGLHRPAWVDLRPSPPASRDSLAARARPRPETAVEGTPLVPGSGKRSV